ncbi:MAG TPA: hypothetical protein P5016_11360 [Verrucomicrobiales bacterium]|nr:sodium-coupled permease [Verrucomicrobiae bacterium]MCP5553642.1 sodium-coupled permease [Akkermansiaceae bacterium]HRX55104.1 hypothetical protein [Verrucomicrobiales bacterium]
MILLSQTLNTPPPQGLLFVDWSIIALYAGLTIFLGWWYGRSQTSTKEYFVGSGAMNPWLVGVSLFATLLSTITYLSKPGEMLGKGPVVMVDILMYPLVFLVVAFWLLPIYMKHKVTSAYELLENRLGLGIRLLAVGLFLLLRLVWMSLLIYLTAKAITTMCGLDKKWIIAVVIAAGTVSMIYTSLGGMRAVVITDLIQTILLYGGALLVIGTVTWKMGGVSWFPTQWKPHWDHQPFFSFDISTRVTVFGTLLSMFLWFVGTSGSDQVTVQRFMSTKDVSAARRALGMQLGVGALVGLTLSLVGFALLGFFEANPGSLAPGLSLKGNADEIFPYFIAYHLPPVVSGLVVSGLFAAAMSSIDSGVNSITAVVMTDLMERLGWQFTSEGGHVKWAKILALVVGILVVCLSTLAVYVPGNITAVTNKTVNLFTMPLFCLFFFALFSRQASPVGVAIGTLCGMLTAILIGFSGPIFIAGFDPKTQHDPVSFQWIAPVTLIVNLTTGYFFSWLIPRRNTTQAA